jgi:preprotein translocase subunit SecG
MDDDLLYQIRPPVRKAFAESLFQRLSSLSPQSPSQRLGAFQAFRSFMRPLTWKVALLFILALMALTFVLSEQARARALEWIKVVAGFTVEERSESPLKSYEEGKVQATEYTTAPTLSVPEALAEPPFPFSLPTWVPEGYTIDETVTIANSKTWVMLNWKNPNGGGIFMLVEPKRPKYNLPAGEDSSEEIQINGQPALLIRGDWASVDRWDPRLAVTIYWEKNGIYYRLGYGERKPIQDMEAIIQQLIRMAESVP